MKKRDLIEELRWRVDKLEAVGEQRKESRDAEIANMKTVHEVSAFWRMRADDLQKKLSDPSVQGERIKELEQRLDTVRRERDEFAKQWRHAAKKDDGEHMMRKTRKRRARP
jgi:hypothetical protein